MTIAEDPTAALLVIGNEILSGRTQDVNVNAVAAKLGEIGIPLKEARVVADIEREIVAALNDLRRQYTYVLTTGGIGPTHDDITVDAVAAAFGVSVIESAEARAMLAAHFGETGLTPARLRMARIPQGATLIDNPVSFAPGIAIENVYVMAGVPAIMQGMLDGVALTLRHGPKVHSITISGLIAESVLAEDLRALAARHASVDIGSYPWMREGTFGTALVARGTDGDAVQSAAAELKTLMTSKGAEGVS